MKWTLTALLIIGGTSSVFAQMYGSSRSNSYQSGLYGTGSNPQSHQTDGYFRNNGTYVAPHYQTNPNNTQFDNYGTRGNVNPYSGIYGTRSPRY